MEYDIYSKACQKPELLLDFYQESKMPLIGYSCSYIPEELIIAVGAQPYRISDLEAQRSSLTPNFVCPFAASVLSNMLKLERYFSAFVLAHTCDPMWRMYDILKKKISKPVFLLRVPHNTDNPLSLQFFKRELIRLKEFLEESLGVKMQNDSLKKSIKICNRNRKLMKDLYLSNLNENCSIDSANRFKLVLSGFWLPREKHSAIIENACAKFRKKHNIEDKVKLHLSGTALYHTDLIERIEELGGIVVSDDLCTGSRYFWDNVEEGEEPISAIAYRYLRRTPCPSHAPLEKRLDFIKFMISKFKAQGVLIITGRFCDPLLYDSIHIREMLTKIRVPSTVVDYENFDQELPRIQTRIETFIEMLSSGG